jgi:hypothetical protein
MRTCGFAAYFMILYRLDHFTQIGTTTLSGKEKRPSETSSMFPRLYVLSISISIGVDRRPEDANVLANRRSHVRPGRVLFPLSMRSI